MHLNKCDLDRSALEKLCKVFENVYKDEIKSRVLFESTVKDYYRDQGKQNYKELALAHFSMMENRDEVDEVAYQCKFCTDFCYFSAVECKVHSAIEGEDVSKVPENETKHQKR